MKNKSKLFITNLIYFIIICLLVAVRIITAFLPDPEVMGIDATLYDTIFTMVVQIGLMFILPISLYTVFRKQKVKTTFTEFKYKKLSFLSVLICILIGICCYIFNIVIGTFFSAIISLFGYEAVPAAASVAGAVDKSVWPLILNLIMIAVLPALGEETVHRGMLLNGYSKIGLKRAVIYSSLMFGLIHLNIGQVFFATFLGFLMAITVIMSGRIWPAIIIHFINNAVNVYFDWATKTESFAGGFMPWLEGLITSSNAITVFIVSFVFLLSLLALMAGLYMLLLKETRIKRLRQLFAQVGNINSEDHTKLQEMGKTSPFSANYLQNLEVLNAMMLKYNLHSSQDLIFNKQELKYNKPTRWENLFFYGAMALGICVTVFTFIWGLL